MSDCYVHKVLKCFVTSENFKQYGIESLDDPNMYRVLDMPEVDFLTNNVTFGEPSFDEKEHTAQVYPKVTPLSDEYKTNMLAQYREQQFDKLVVFYDKVDDYLFFEYDGAHYRFPFDINKWYALLQYRAGKNSQYCGKVPFPVLVVDLKTNEIKDRTVLYLEDNEMKGIMSQLGNFATIIATNASDGYSRSLNISFEELVTLVRQNTHDKLIPDDPFSTTHIHNGVMSTTRDS